MKDLSKTKEIKDKIIENTSKGFSYYLKDVLFTILILIGCYIFCHPEIITNPSIFFEDFDRSAIYSVFGLLIMIISIYKIGKSMLKESKEYESEENDKKMSQLKKEHTAEALNRLKCAPEISLILKDLLINLNASRSSVCEIHNGTNSLVGVPFLHLTMMTEETNNEVSPSSDDYNCLNISRMPFIISHFDDTIWIGNISEIEHEDKFLYGRLKSNNDNYIGMIILEGIHGPLGLLTVAFKNLENLPDKDEITSELVKASRKLQNLLDKK